MTVGQMQGFATTKRGTRPGSPLADCIFHVLMADILHQLQRWIDSQTEFQALLKELDISGGFVAWADDLAIPWATRTAAAMPEAIRNVLEFVVKLFQRYGFLLNMDKGKTSAVVSFRGVQAPMLRQQYQLCACPGDSFAIDGKEFFLHYVPSYKHLGTILAANHSFEIEIRSRIGQAQAAFNQIAKPILCNKHIAEITRVRLFHTLVGSKLFLGLGAWITPSVRQLAKLRAALLRMLQRVLRFQKNEMLTVPADEVFRRGQQSDPRVRLAVDRLLYAQRLWEFGPAELQHLLHREQALCKESWIDGLQADLSWLANLEQDKRPSIDVHDLSALFDFWQSGSPEWARRVKQGFRRHQRQEHMMQRMHRFHGQFVRTLQTCATLLGPDQASTEVGVANLACFCGRQFTTPQGLAAHQRRVHQIGALERHLIDGPTCPSCLKFFWCRQRLYQHLAYVSRRTGINACFQDLQRRGFYVLDEILPDKSTQPRGLHRTEALQALGPFLQPKDSRTNALLLAKQRLAAIEAELFQLVFPEDAEQQQALFWDRLTAVTHQWFQRFQDSGFDSSIITQLPDDWLDVAATADPAFGEWLEQVYIRWGDNCLADVIATFEDGEAELLVDNAYADFIYDFPRMRLMTEAAALRQKILRLEAEQGLTFPHRPPRFGPANHQERRKTALTIRSLFGQQTAWLAQIRAFKFDRHPDSVPIPASVDSCTYLPCFLIVHLFSGRRRDTDIHAHLDALARHRGYRVQVLSLDTAVSVFYGNLQSEHSTWRHLATLYQAGRIAATICGSPCETFSAARHHAPDDSHSRWPKPLRSALRFFGLDGLTTRELRQAEQGAEFFMQGLLVAAWTIQFGGVYLSEHPWKPEDPDKVSIWTSPWIELLLKLTNVRLHRVCQWRWGSSAVKPTGILAIKCPNFLRSAYQYQLPDVVKPSSVAIGRDVQTGSFRTAVLKEYPPAFSQALAGAVADCLESTTRHHRFAVGQTADPDAEAWLLAARAACAVIRTDAPWLPDFQG